MKACVLRVFKNKEHWINYTYVDVAKYRDDHDSYSKERLYVPMMEIRLFDDDSTLKGDNSFKGDTILTIATPEVIKKYTGFDIFFGDYDYTYMFENRFIDDVVIEFEWVEEVYPYGDIKDHWSSLTINSKPATAKWLKSSEDKPLLKKDYIISDAIRFPKISKISRGVFFHNGLLFDEID